MSAPVDVCGILERAGADAQAPEGSQAWALAQVDEVVSELVEAVNAFDIPASPMTPRLARLRGALARVHPMTPAQQATETGLRG